jgi:DNA-directed RNA polymerase subunit beta'
MLQLPPVLAARYRPATEREVHSWSFGLLKATRNPRATAWEQRRGTLEDQALFGPLRDFECACGKYRGPQPRLRGSVKQNIPKLS